jgi:hypothetical protein
MAHNKLPALQREGWRRGMDMLDERAHEGRPVMLHAAQDLLGLEPETAVFKEGVLSDSHTKGPSVAVVPLHSG